jgi:DNA-directed RNA polymerase subunit N (RpoN/RPB10)
MSRKIPAQEKKSFSLKAQPSRTKSAATTVAASTPATVVVLVAVATTKPATQMQDDETEKVVSQLQPKDDKQSTFISLLVPILCDTCGFEIQSCADRYKRGLLDGKESKEAMDECGVPMYGPFDQEDAVTTLPSLCCRRISTMISFLPDHNRLQDFRRFFDG